MGFVLLDTTGQDDTAGAGKAAGLLSRRKHPCIGSDSLPFGTSYLWGVSQSHDAGHKQVPKRIHQYPCCSLALLAVPFPSVLQLQLVF